MEITPTFVPPETPAARITLLRAWREAAFQPSRSTFEALASAANRRWIVVSLVVTRALSYLSRALFWLAQHGAPGLYASTSRPVQSAGEAAIYYLLLFPATFIFGVFATAYVFGVFATAYVVARFAPAARGPLGVRFQQVLRPNALALVPSQCVVLIITLIPTANPNGTDLGHLALSCFALVVVLAALPYEIALLVNSLSAGSGRSRLAVFLLSLLAEVITLALTKLVPALLARPFGVRLLPYNLPLLR